MALCTLPELLDDPKYPDDVKEKARFFLADCKGHSVGKIKKLKFSAKKHFGPIGLI